MIALPGVLAYYLYRHRGEEYGNLINQVNRRLLGEGDCFLFQEFCIMGIWLINIRSVMCFLKI